MIQSKVLIVSLTAVMLSACVVAPYPGSRAVYSEPGPVAYGGGGEVVVDQAPPPPYVESVPAIPFAGAVWIGGYWGWNGGRHMWVPGRYEHGRPGYGWRPHAWVNEGGHWRLHNGGWERR
jgi:WXXGXW repeat (2 copies)